VGHDVALAAGPAVAIQPVAHTRREQVAPRTVDRLPQCVAIPRQQGQQSGEIGRIPVPVEVGLGQADVATRQNLPEHRFIMHLQGDAMLACPEQAARTVGQANFEDAAGNPFEESENQAGRGAGPTPPRRVIVLFICSIPEGVAVDGKNAHRRKARP
jgi:hypothetical protein